MKASPLYAQACCIASRAVEADNAGRNHAAVEDYTSAADLLLQCVDAEPDLRKKEVMTASIKQYCARAEKIRAVLAKRGLASDVQAHEPLPVAVAEPASRYALLWKEATDHLYHAIARDRTGDYDEAVSSYISASQLLLEYLKLRGKAYGSKRRLMVIDKVNEYVSRVEVLRRFQRRPHDDLVVDVLGFSVVDFHGDEERARAQTYVESFVGARAGEQVVSAWLEHKASECGKTRLTLPTQLVELIARRGLNDLVGKDGTSVPRCRIWRCLSGACVWEANAAAEGITYESLLRMEVEEGCPDVGVPLVAGASVPTVCPSESLSDEQSAAQALQDRTFARTTDLMKERYPAHKLSSLAVIEVDLRRTFVNHAYARTPPFICSLRRVLRAYWRRSQHGYTQAQNTLAGFVLLVSCMDEALSLWMLTVLSESDSFHEDYYADDCRGWSEVDMVILQDLIFDRCPLLNPATNPDLPEDWASHFSLLLQGGLVMQWYYKVFVNLAATNFVLRVWDVMLAGGGTAMLHRLVLTIFEQHAAQLAEVRDPFHAQGVLGPAIDLVDYGALMANLMSPQNSFITPEWLKARRAEIKSDVGVR